MKLLGWWAWLTTAGAAVLLDGWWQTGAVVLLVVLGITAEFRVVAQQQLIDALRMRERG